MTNGQGKKPVVSRSRSALSFDLTVVVVVGGIVAS